MIGVKRKFRLKTSGKKENNFPYRYFVDWEKVGIGSPLKADDHGVPQTKETSLCFLSERRNSLVNKVAVS